MASVPTEVPSDLEEEVASGEGVPAPSGPTVTPPSPAMTSVPVEAAASPSTGAELEALAKKQRLARIGEDPEVQPRREGDNS